MTTITRRAVLPAILSHALKVCYAQKESTTNLKLNKAKTMKRNITTIACCAVILSASSSAYCAEPPTENNANSRDTYQDTAQKGLYLSGTLGFARVQDANVESSPMDFSYEDGFNIGVAIGYGIEDNIRLEVELTYLENDMDKVNVSGLGSASTTGNIESVALLFNGHIDLKNDTPIITTLSGGAGIAKVDLDVDSATGIYAGASDDDKVFAYQLGLGFGYALQENIILELKYRYFATDDFDFEGDDVEFKTHNISFGTRIFF